MNQACHAERSSDGCGGSGPHWSALGFWQWLRARFMPPVHEPQLPGSLLAQLSDERTAALREGLMLLRPLTTEATSSPSTWAALVGER